MMLLLWSAMFFLLAVFASTVGAVALMGMPVATEVQATVMGLTVAVVAFGLVLLAFPPFPTLRDRDRVPPYVFGSKRAS